MPAVLDTELQGNKGSENSQRWAPRSPGPLETNPKYLGHFLSYSGWGSLPFVYSHPKSPLWENKPDDTKKLAPAAVS